MSNLHLADKDAPVCQLVVKPHFDALNAKERLYAHHMSRASYYGSRAVMRQVSPESETIYDLIIALYKAAGEPGTNEEWTKKLVEGTKVSDEDSINFLEYASQFLSNMGNFKSFGDSKFIPRLSSDSFKAISSIDAKAKALFEKIGKVMYSTEPEKANLLGFPDQGHVTSYYSSDITKEAIMAIKNIMADIGMMPENTRVFKAKDDLYLLKIASAVSESSGEFKNEYEIPGFGKLKLEYGDHQEEFKNITREIEAAAKYAANETQTQMLKQYAESFRTGSMKAHKDSQVSWVKDLNPKVETNIGFIETYRDPAGIRGEWEGLVAMVNVEQTKKYGVMVENAKNYISQLPWPKDFEKDKFTPPDFTSLEVMTFAGSGIPAGINIPNYDDVRMTVGFKNVSLGNVTSIKVPQKPQFIADDEADRFDELTGVAFEVQVGIHELLGHGTGKLLSETDNGVFNFDKENPPMNPLDNKPVTTYYKKGETWASLFGFISGSFEECRAELTAMYLCTDMSMLKIFGHEGQEADDVVFTSYLLMARQGLAALEYWDPASGKWGQPHMQARFSIMKCFMEAGDDFVKFEYTKPDYSDLVIRLDRTKIVSHGKKAVGNYLQHLHIYKSTGDVVRGTEYYTKQTTVTSEYAKFRPAVLAAKRPRRQIIQATSFLNKDGADAELKVYEDSYAGMIASFADRDL